LTALRQEPRADGPFDKTIGLLAREFKQFRPPERHVIARNTVGPNWLILALGLRSRLRCLARRKRTVFAPAECLTSALQRGSNLHRTSCGNRFRVLEGGPDRSTPPLMWPGRILEKRNDITLGGDHPSLAASRHRFVGRLDEDDRGIASLPRRGGAHPLGKDYDAFDRIQWQPIKTVRK